MARAADVAFWPDGPMAGVVSVIVGRPPPVALVRGGEMLHSAIGKRPVEGRVRVEGVDVSNAVIGERWVVGNVELEVCQPRIPCLKLALRFEDPQMVKRFAQAGRAGAYLRILREGDVGAGDPVEVLDRPGHGITIAFVARAIFGDRELRTRALTAPRLADSAVVLLRERAPEAGRQGATAQTTACSTAQRASSERRRSPVFSRMRVRWFCTVRGEM